MNTTSTILNAVRTIWTDAEIIDTGGGCLAIYSDSANAYITDGDYGTDFDATRTLYAARYDEPEDDAPAWEESFDMDALSLNDITQAITARGTE